MLFSGVGRSAVRLLSKQPCSLYWRVDLSTDGLKRAAPRYSSYAPSRSSTFDLAALRTAIEPHHFTRAFATRPASKPKAHTGRTAAKPRAAKKTASTRKPSDAKKKKQELEPKAIAKPKPKKTLTAEEKQKKLVLDLRKAALRTPKELPSTAFTIISADIAREIRQLAPARASQTLKELRPEEREHYNHLANANKEKNKAAYKSWIQSHTPGQIRNANLARARLRKLGVKRFRALVDDRQPKRPGSPHSLYLHDRYKSGDMSGIGFVEAGRMILREWKELAQADKQQYMEAFSREQSRYRAECKNAYGRESYAAAAA